MAEPQKIKTKKNDQLNKSLSRADIREIWGIRKWKNIFAHADCSTIVMFRILFGCIMFYEVVHYINLDLITRYWLHPLYHFTYWPFDFVKPLPGNGMHILFYVMGLLSIFMITGFLYRISTFLFWLGFTYSFLLDQARYLNHFYLVSLICLIMIFIPANTSASVDSRIVKKIRSGTVPVWSIWLLRFTIGLPYFFGGIAKINLDWLHGQPLQMWLKGDSDFPVIGPYMQEYWMILLLSYSGLLLDLFIVPVLLYRKTRVAGILFITTFHLMNSRLFEIGIFPWFMIAGLTVFLDPDTPRKVINFFSGRKPLWPLIASVKPVLAGQLVLNRNQKLIVAGLVAWFCIHVFLPVRHFFIPGNVHWTEEGHQFAWHMKLRTKRGAVEFRVKDKKTGAVEVIDIKTYLTDRQQEKMGGRPDMIWQFCKIIKESYQSQGIDVAVYADAKATLNGRNYQQLIDSTVDLASVPRYNFSHAPWITQLTTSLDDRLKEYSDEDSE